MLLLYTFIKTQKMDCFIFYLVKKLEILTTIHIFCFLS